MANDSINNMPRTSDKEATTPLQLFSSSNVQIPPKHWKPFGCPVYVLNSKLQTKAPIFHKWKARAKAGIYLGRSPSHASSIALVLDTNSGLVSPQFHVIFDANFTTVKDLQDQPMNWQIRTGLVKDQSQELRTESTDDKRPETIPTTESETQQSGSLNGESPISSVDRDDAEPTMEDLPNQDVHSDADDQDDQREEAEDSNIPEDQGQQPVHDEPNGRSRRKRKPRIRLIEVMESLYKKEVETTTDPTRESNGGTSEILSMEATWGEMEHYSTPETLSAMKAVADPDSMYLHEAMKQPDRDQFVSAMDKEVRDQMENGNFSILHRSEVPEGATILPTVWQLRRKRDIITRAIKKWKARLSIDGSKMKRHRDYELTYAPVASWNSIRLMLTMTLVHGWKTQQIDFVQAFPQAPIEREMYMTIPKGYTITGANPKDYVLQVHKNIYGQKQAGRVWNQHLVSRLLKIGFVQSQHDECVFYCGKVMYVLYTNDSILAGPSRKDIDKVIERMRSTGLDLTLEGTLSDFLGVNLDRRDDGTIHLHQPHLIDQILEDLRLSDENVNTKDIPMASSKLLAKHIRQSLIRASIIDPSLVSWGTLRRVPDQILLMPRISAPDSRPIPGNNMEKQFDG